MYTYNAKVDRVVDGDTVDALVDLGFDTWKKVRIRLYGLDAWESRTRDLDEKKKGLAAKQYLIDQLESNDNKFVLVSHGVGKYGRCLGELFLQKDGWSINDHVDHRRSCKKILWR
jgi:micrococcal nuclease